LGLAAKRLLFDRKRDLVVGARNRRRLMLVDHPSTIAGALRMKSALTTGRPAP